MLEFGGDNFFATGAKACSVFVGGESVFYCYVLADRLKC